jgi:hypothetical protein
MTKVTYVPHEPTDPAVIMWNGVKFTANTPVDLDPIKHAITVPLPEKTIVEGQVRTIHHDRRVPMAEIAKGNPGFVVEGAEPAVARKPGRPRTPKTAEDYRGYAQAWFAAAESAEDMQERWEQENELREKCGCGEDDVEYLNAFYQAKHKELMA